MSGTAEFTFFPDENEAEIIKNYSVEQLVKAFLNQEDLMAQFMHELIRTDRIDDLKEVMKLLALREMLDEMSEYGMGENDYEDQIRETQYTSSKIFNGLVSAIGFMMAAHNVPREKAEDFANQTVDMLNDYFEDNTYVTEYLMSLATQSVLAYNRLKN